MPNGYKFDRKEYEARKAAKAKAAKDTAAAKNVPELRDAVVQLQIAVGIS
jgi:hypothetical protein